MFIQSNGIILLIIPNYLYFIAVMVWKIAWLSGEIQSNIYNHLLRSILL